MKANNKRINLIISMLVIGLFTTGIDIFFRDQQYFLMSNAFAQENLHHSVDHQLRSIIIFVTIIFAFAVLIWLVIKKQTSKLQRYNDLYDTPLTQQRQSHWYIYILAIIFFLIVFTAVNTFIRHKSSDKKKIIKQNDTSLMKIQTEKNQNKIIQIEKNQPPENVLNRIDTLKHVPKNEIKIKNEVSHTKNVKNQSSGFNDSTHIQTSKHSNIQTNKPDKSNPKQAVLTESTDKKAVTKNSITNSIGMTFVYIPPGSFQMGSPITEKQRAPSENLHSVTFNKGFYMQTTEITNEQFVLFLNQSHIDKKWLSVNDSYIGYQGHQFTVEPNYKTYPAISLSWYAVDAMARWLTKKEKVKYRIPSEAEWEYAARAGTTTPFYFGNCLTADQSNYNGNKPYVGCTMGSFRDHPIPVGHLNYPNKWKLHDMHGNVNEWCFDWFIEKYLMKQPCINPTGPKSGLQKVVRGGCYKYGASECRSAARNRFNPQFKGKNIGGRLIREIK